MTSHPGLLGHHRQQRGLADAGRREEAEPLAGAAGGKAVKDTHPQIDRRVPGAPAASPGEALPRTGRAMGPVGRGPSPSIGSHSGSITRPSQASDGATEKGWPPGRCGTARAPLHRRLIHRSAGTAPRIRFRGRPGLFRPAQQPCRACRAGPGLLSPGNWRARYFGRQWRDTDNRALQLVGANAGKAGAALCVFPWKRGPLADANQKLIRIHLVQILKHRSGVQLFSKFMKQ